MKEPPGRIAVLVTLALGLGAASLGALTGRDLIALHAFGARHIATVVATERAATGAGSSNLAAEGAVFALDLDGARVERPSYLASGDYRFDIGERVEVLVLPGLTAVHPADDWKALLFPAAFTALGLGLIAMGVGAWRRRL